MVERFFLHDGTIKSMQIRSLVFTLAHYLYQLPEIFGDGAFYLPHVQPPAALGARGLGKKYLSLALGCCFVSKLTRAKTTAVTKSPGTIAWNPQRLGLKSSSPA